MQHFRGESFMPVFQQITWWVLKVNFEFKFYFLIAPPKEYLKAKVIEVCTSVF